MFLTCCVVYLMENWDCFALLTQLGGKYYLGGDGDGVTILKNVFSIKKNFFWPCHTPRGILVPQPGIEPASPALEGWSFNHWTAREVLGLPFLK